MGCAVGKSVGPGALLGVCSGAEQRDGLRFCYGEGWPGGPCPLLPPPSPLPQRTAATPWTGAGTATTTARWRGCGRTRLAPAAPTSSSTSAATPSLPGRPAVLPEVSSVTPLSPPWQHPQGRHTACRAQPNARAPTQHDVLAHSTAGCTHVHSRRVCSHSTAACRYMRAPGHLCVALCGQCSRQARIHMQHSSMHMHACVQRHA